MAKVVCVDPCLSTGRGLHWCQNNHSWSSHAVQVLLWSWTRSWRTCCRIASLRHQRLHQRMLALWRQREMEVKTPRLGSHQWRLFGEVVQDFSTQMLDREKYMATGDYKYRHCSLIALRRDR